jgi:hypothetical protein
MLDDNLDAPRACKLCGGEMKRNGTERRGRDLGGRREGAQPVVEELVACTRCYTLQWVEAQDASHPANL